MIRALSLLPVFAALFLGPAALAAEAAGASPIELQKRSVSPPPAMSEADPLKLYGDEAIYDVYRKGKKIGEHHVVFSRNDYGDVNVKVTLKLQVSILFIKRAYSFDYSSEEIWRDKVVISMAAVANDNGNVTRTNAVLQDGTFIITGSRSNVLANSWVVPTSHWNRGQVNAAVLLNTLNNRLADVKIQNKGFEEIETADGAVEAEHFLYTGDLRDIDSWYDISGRWVKLRFKAKDGSYVEYICRKCGVRN
jgi:Family of unknown function (DUF6134)